MDYRADVAVVGGGIVGLAFARAAAVRGRSVVLFERGARAEGASVRNFGMVWPVGQTAGEWYQTALRSRDVWSQVAAEGDIWAAACGSVHVAHEDDEDAVLREFADRGPAAGVSCEYLSAADAVRRFPAINPVGLRGALYSPTEMCVDPRQAVARLPDLLRERHGVDVRFGTTVVDVSMPFVRTADGDRWQVGDCFVCSGAEFSTLFPSVFAASGLRRCKLQMMRTRPQPGGWRLGPHVAGGLTLCHYAGFQGCPSLSVVRERVARDYPEYVRYGIHVMASQNHLGEVVIGDSHEYDDAIQPFDSPVIDELILAYLRKLVRLPDWAPAGRWHGIYAKHPDRVCYTAEPQPGCHVITSPGGAGMTLAFGLGERWWDAQVSRPVELVGGLS